MHSKRLLALGRKKQGEMNKTEAAYAQWLEARKHEGVLAWYAFEGMKFRLADNTFYTPDFCVLMADGALEMHEVKGAKGVFMDDAKVKVKVAAEMYPVRFFVAFPVPKSKGGGWEWQEY